MVSPDEDAFEDAMREQLADLLDTTTFNVRDLRLDRGSVVVQFEAAAYDDGEEGELKKSYADLADMFKDGDVVLVRRRYGRRTHTHKK